MAEANGIPNDYDVSEKLQVYEEIMEDAGCTSGLCAYNVKRLMPEVRGKTVLDLPCGIGLYVRMLHELGAAKVIASDIVSRQIEVSKEKDKEAAIPEGFVEYHQHDAAIPEQLSRELADVCLCVHLLCYAETEDQLRGMVRTILANLKPGGCCFIATCFLRGSATDEQTVRKELEKYEEEMVHLDPPSSERLKPRHYHSIVRGFHFNRYIWPQQVVYDVLREEGFSKIETVPFEVNPSYKGDVDLQGYIDLNDQRAIFAWK